MILEDVVTPFVLILLGELGDKSNLAVLTIASREKNVRGVLTGIMIGLGGMTLIGYFVGALIFQLVPAILFNLTAGGIFIVLGAYSFRCLIRPNTVRGHNGQINREEAGAEHEEGDLTPCLPRPYSIAKVASLVFMLELGDKTQIMLFFLVANANSPHLAAVSCFAALLVVNTMSIALGREIGKRVPLKHIQIASGALFMVFGVGALLGVL